MREGSRTALDQEPMGEESPQLCSALSNGHHEQTDMDLGPSCCHHQQTDSCADPGDGGGERPVSLVSSLSSGSSRDSRSLCGSTSTLQSSVTPPGEEDIELELSPAVGTREQARGQSSPLGLSRHQRLERQGLVAVGCQQNGYNSSRTGSGETPHTLTSPVATDAMAPNPKLTYVDRVVMEIIETERMYVRDLRSIVEDYLAHIIDVGNLPIRPEQVCGLFGNIEDIYEFNSELLQSLDMCQHNPVAIARCFVDKSEYFEIYTQYCTNYPNSVAALTDCMRSKPLAKFFRERQAALKRSLPLGSYLLKPVQRILKYHLLLQEIAKHFDPEEQGYEVIQEAIYTMTGVALYINDMKRKHEHAVRLQEIQSLLINWKGPDLTTYGELVLEGTFHVMRAKNSRTLFLFDKMLLITKKRGEHYVYKNHILCSTLMLLDGAKDPLLFSVIHFKHPKQPHTVQAKSVEEKRLWAQHIKRLILENHHTVVPLKANEAILEMDSTCPAKYRYSPERLKKTASCKVDEFPFGGRNERRRSEPAKQIMRNTKAILKHAGSEGALLRDSCFLHPASSVSTLASSLGEPQAERPFVEEDVEELSTRRDSLEQLSPFDSDPWLGCSPSVGSLEEEGQGYKEDILMGDDQVADFASSMLAAISCWHYRARALLSTHFTTGEPDRGTEAELKTDMMGPSTQEKPRVNCFEEALTTQLNEQQLSPRVSSPPSEDNDRLEELQSYCSPVSPSLSTGHPEDEAAEPEANSSALNGEEEEGGSDSSGVQVEETSTLTTSEYSEEDEDVVFENKSILPSSVLDQASVIAERFVSSLSRRSSLVSEDTGSMSSPSHQLDNQTSKHPPSLCLELQDKPMFVSPFSQPLSDINVTSPLRDPAVHLLMEGERRSTLSKQDRLLIHKIRSYYEHAEHQDANFSIKRRESLSYIPAGLVRHLSKVLNNVPQDQTIMHRKGSSHTRPTSWSVFDLPSLEKNEKAEQHNRLEPLRSLKGDTKSLSFSDHSSTDEEFRLSSEILKVWQDMEVNENFEENQNVKLFDEKPNGTILGVSQRDISSETSTSDSSVRELEEPEKSVFSDGSFISSPIPSISGMEDRVGKVCCLNKTPNSKESDKAVRAAVPQISLRSGVEEDEILQDMGRMKNKVFQLARQYSQRIKNNRPLIRQKIKDSEHQIFKKMPPVHEEKMHLKDTGPPNLTLPLNTHNEVIIHKLCSPNPSQSSSSGANSQLTTPSSMPATSPSQTEPFHWPDVQELRSKYTNPVPEEGVPHRLPVGRSSSMSDKMLEHCSEGFRSITWNPIDYTPSCNGSPDPHVELADCQETHPGMVQESSRSVGEDELLSQAYPPLCRWSSLDHVPRSLPLHEVQNFQHTYTGGQATIPNEHKVFIVERVPMGKLEKQAHEGIDCVKTSAASRPGKKMESNIVRNLKEKFQSLSSGL